MWKCRFFCLFLVLPAWVIAESNDHPSAEQILASYEQSLNFMQERVAFDVEIDTVYEGAYNWDIQPKKRLIEANIRRDNGRLDTIANQKLSYASDSRKQRSTERKRRKILDNNEGMTYSTSNGNPPKYVLIDNRDPDGFTGGLNGLIDSGRFLDGYTPGHPSFSIPEAMREGGLRLRDEMEVVDGHKTYVLEAKNQYGEKILWIDPEFGFNPRRIIMRRTANTMYDEETLRRGPDPLPPGSISREPVSLISLEEIKLESIEIEKLGDAFVPKMSTITVSTSYANGESTKSIAQYNRKNMDLTPDFDSMGAFILDVPDGTPIDYLDSIRDTIHYEWRGGKVLLYIDDLAMEAIDNVASGLDLTKPLTVSHVSPNNDGDLSSKLSKTPSTNQESLPSVSQGKRLVLISVVTVISIIVFIIYLMKRKEFRNARS